MVKVERTDAGDLQQDIGVVQMRSKKDEYHAAPDGNYVTFTEVEQDRKSTRWEETKT
jgi:hypothetical protein